MAKRVGGIIFIKADGVQFDAKGSYEYDLGVPKRDPVIGSDRSHGYKELPKEAYISGTITDNDELDVKNDLLGITNATITLELANGKVIVLRNAYFSGDGTTTTEEGEIAVRFTGDSPAEEIPV